MTSSLNQATAALARDLKTPRFVFDFSVSLDKEIDETTTRVEEGKTITETTKVKRSVSVPFGFKKPSRSEAFDADLERSVWETKFVTAGILPQALLLKTYANYGGILSNEQKDGYNKMQADFLLAETELKRLQINDKDNKEAITKEALRIVTLRQAIIQFQQDQAVFFSNTAEAKAREKLIEWLVLHLTYYRPLNSAGEPGEWTQFFAGTTTEDKLVAFDAILDNQDEMWIKARELVELIATLFASSGDNISREEIAEFAKEMAK